MPDGKAAGFGKVLLWLTAIVFVCITAGEVFFYYENRPLGSGKQEVEFTIDEGESWQDVMTNLEEKKLIRSAKFGDLLLKFERGAEHYAGKYLLDDGMTTQEIIEFLSNSENQLSRDIPFTIAPGTWAKDVAVNLSKYFPYTPQEFIDEWNNIDYIRTLSTDYPFLDVQTLSNNAIKVKLEGYLYPDTYAIVPDASIDQITRTFLNGFKNMYEENKQAFDSSSMSVEEIVTLASIVQFESGSNEDMPKIAGVFDNRLEQGMRLESSVTVCYALYDNFDSPTACETNTDIDSPYNTYLYEGLPVGPIDNPGKAAILAVLNPEDNDYLFFAADINHVKDGGVYYSKTYEEHNQIASELGLLY